MIVLKLLVKSRDGYDLRPVYTQIARGLLNERFDLVESRNKSNRSSPNSSGEGKGIEFHFKISLNVDRKASQEDKDFVESKLRERFGEDAMMRMGIEIQ